MPWREFININQAKEKIVIMFQKIVRIYKQNGLPGVISSGTRYGFQQIAKFFLNSAEWVSTNFPISHDDKKILDRNRIFKNKHKSCRCFVIGNGPSLKKQDLSHLSNEITIVVNAFWKNNTIEGWQPTYYCLADQNFFNDSRIAKEFYQNIKLGTHSTIFLIPLFAKKIIEDHNLLPLDKTFFVSYRGRLNSNLQREIELTKTIPSVVNVVQLGIMWALYMGCSSIYLLGLDHDWLSSYDGKVNHFYKGETIKYYSNKQKNLGQIGYKKNIERALALWQGYETLLKISSQKGVNIINATDGGFLDVFKRLKYESIFFNNNKQ
jgi:hypothetical protein